MVLRHQRSPQQAVHEEREQDRQGHQPCQGRQGSREEAHRHQERFDPSREVVEGVVRKSSSL